MAIYYKTRKNCPADMVSPADINAVVLFRWWLNLEKRLLKITRLDILDFWLERTGCEGSRTGTINFGFNEI